jgi:hypothetical protein
LGPAGAAVVVTTDQVLDSVGTGRQQATTGVLLAAFEAIRAWRIGWSPALPDVCVPGAAGTEVAVVDVQTHHGSVSVHW